MNPIKKGASIGAAIGLLTSPLTFGLYYDIFDDFFWDNGLGFLLPLFYLCGHEGIGCVLLMVPLHATLFALCIGACIGMVFTRARSQKPSA